MKSANITQTHRRTAAAQFGKIRFFALILALLTVAAATFYSTSLASASGSAGVALSAAVGSATGIKAPNAPDFVWPAAIGNRGSLDWLPGSGSLAPPMTGNITLYAADCTTPQTTFQPGDTICATITGIPLVLNVRVDWLGTTNLIQQKGSTLGGDPQNVTFTLPTNAPLGAWRINVSSQSDSSVRASETFYVSNPATPTSNLIVSTLAKEPQASAGGDISFDVLVINRGPDAATNVSLTDVVPGNTTFVLSAQVGGPTFTCSNPSAGGVGTSTCTLASLAPGDTAAFQFEYNVSASAPNGTTITNTASVTSDVTDPNTGDNTRSAQVDVTAQSCIVSCPSNVTAQNDPNQYGAVVTYPNPTGSGSCGTIESFPASGSFFPVGTTVVTAAGDSGNSCSFTVTVNDTQAPTFNSCPSNIETTESPAGSGSATVNYATPTASDNDPAGAVVTCDHPSGSSFPVGVTSVICTATDAAGNTTSSCTFDVTVTTQCGINCPANITQNVDGTTCGAVVTYTAPTTANCSGNETVTQIAGLASGSTFPVGTTTNTFKVTDGATTSTCSFTVTVVDNVAPSISCPANITVNTSGNSCLALVTVTAPTATDNCSGATVTGVRDDGLALNSAYPVGTTVITWTAHDAAGNVATCDQNIFVKDNTAPTAAVNVPDTVVGALMTVNADASCLAPVPDLTAFLTASDNCVAHLTVVQIPTADSGIGDSLVGPGAHPITIKVSDVDPADPDATPGNTTTLTKMNIVHLQLDSNGDPVLDANGNPVFTIVNTVDMIFTVVDAIPPTITLNGADPITVECHTSFTDPGATAHDNCSPDFAATANSNVNINVPGTYTINYTASDAAGNAAAPISRTVIVEDTLAPTITTNGITPSMWPPNHDYRTFNITDFVSAASDLCDTSVNVGSVYITKVTSDEAENGNGSGNTVNDIVIGSNCKSVQLRAEREGGGDGRVYTIYLAVKDASGRVGTATVKVVVPHNRSQAVVDSGTHYTKDSSCP